MQYLQMPHSCPACLSRVYIWGRTLMAACTQETTAGLRLSWAHHTWPSRSPVVIESLSNRTLD